MQLLASRASGESIGLQRLRSELTGQNRALSLQVNDNIAGYIQIAQRLIFFDRHFAPSFPRGLGMSFLDWSKHFLSPFQDAEHVRLPRFQLPEIDSYMLLLFSKLDCEAGAETTPFSRRMLVRKLHYERKAL